MQQALRVAVIVVHHVAAVPLRCRRASPLVEYGLDPGREAFVGCQQRGQLTLVQVIGDRDIRNIDELVAILEIIDDDTTLPAFSSFDSSFGLQLNGDATASRWEALISFSTWSPRNTSATTLFSSAPLTSTVRICLWITIHSMPIIWLAR